MSKWAFITNHGLVLSYIFRYPYSTAREIALAVGITKRATHKIINELEEAGYISRKRVGRNNEYQVNCELSLQHSGHGEVTVKELLRVLGEKQVEVAKEQMTYGKLAL